MKSVYRYIAIGLTSLALYTPQPASASVTEVAFSGSAPAPAEALTLWYRKPAGNWVTEALPIGNGNMGAMIFGGVNRDHIQFNHKTLWRGSEKTGDLGSYLNFGDLTITNINPGDSAKDYRRELNLRQSVLSVSYSLDEDGAFSREYFASNPDRVIAIHYQADHNGKINVALKLTGAQGGTTIYRPTGAEFSGALPNGMLFHGAIALETKGGTISAYNDGISVCEADEMTIYLCCSTDFDPTAPSHLSGTDPAAEVNEALNAALQKGFERIKADHITDYTSLFGRVDFNIAGASNPIPSDSLLKVSDNINVTNMVDLLVFSYGRYLTIASSRGIDVPSNLQGIWNKDGSATTSAVWASDIHSNINVQMNYWAAEPTNLGECHRPLLNYICNEAQRAESTWRKNAAALGIDEGWVVNTAGNIFGGSSNYKVGKYSVANAWLCDHLWQHYTYNLDFDYLRNQAWPVMRSAVRFWLKRLVKAGDGTLECPHEYSPEQGHIQNATAHSQQLIRMLMTNALKAIDVLGDTMDTTLKDSIQTALATLDSGLRVDENGLLREWKYQENTPNIGADKNYFANDEENIWQSHRHTSHLIGLYPGDLIAAGKDSVIFSAAINSLDDRGDTSTGWARAWRIALWARAGNPDRAYNTLRGFTHPTNSLQYDWHGGLYDNFLNAHATSVFQLEGNFGATAGIAEMLLQSSPGRVVLLPALPQQWAEGSISGLKAQGNFEISLKWAGSVLTQATIKSNAGGPLTIIYPRTEGLAQKEIMTKPGDIYILTPD